MNTVLAGIFTVPFDQVLQIRPVKCRISIDAAVLSESGEKLIRRNVSVWTTTMVCKLKGFRDDRQRPAEPL